MNGKGGVRVIAFGLLVQMFLFLSCEKEISEMGSGKKVDIIFTVDNGEDAVDETVVRSAGTKEPETKVVSLGFDDLYLYATLRPDTTAALRATKAFADGQKVALAAFQTNGTQIGSTGIYTYSSSLGRLVAPANPVGVDPNNSTVYRFVAYSYFADPQNAPGTSGIDPEKDLVWGYVEKPVADNISSRTVTILMKHKFAQIKLKVNVNGIANASIRDMGDVTVSGGKLAGLTPFSGAIASGADVVQELDWPAIGNNIKEVTSVARPVYPIASPGKVSVTIENMTIRVGSVDYPIDPFTIEFNSALAGEASYLLEVSLNRMAFAGSNVYWDSGEGKMKFDVQHNGAGKYYQGVYFKIGSLVGYSPVDDTFYYPNVANGTWSVGSGSGSTVSGEICSYLTNGAWRRPESTELDAMRSGSSLVSGSTSALNAEGTGLITIGRQFNTGKGTLFLPISGGGPPPLTEAQADAGSYARYMGSGSWYLYFTPSGSEIRQALTTWYLTVRCIRN